MKYQSINPWSGEQLDSWPLMTELELDQILRESHDRYLHWCESSLDDRCALLLRLAERLQIRREDLARRITLEMGKPISESLAEIDKCIWVCTYYAENAQVFLQPQLIATDARESFVRFDPSGMIFGIMPWNYPFWQVFRYAVPNLVAGNVVLLKHASNVGGCALDIESLFLEAGFPPHCFSNLMIPHELVEKVIAHHGVSGITLTGSEKAGSTVAQLAGKHLKKSVMELGGSNAFVVMEDANLSQAVKEGVKSRMLNTGQSCIASKRFLVVEPLFEEFAHMFCEEVARLRKGDPMLERTQLGPMARVDLVEGLQKQIHNSVQLGAKILLGGEHSDAFHQPTVVTDVLPGMPLFEEETFGPVAALVRAHHDEHAFALAGQSRFGLGMTLFTRDLERAKKMARRAGDGAVFINTSVASDPRLPFGGTRMSGYGRELSRDGLLEFLNRKTVVIR